MDVINKPFINIKKIIALVVIVIAAIALVSTFGGATATVPAGYKGILLNFGSVVGTLDPGFHWISPIGQSVVLVAPKPKLLRLTKTPPHLTSKKLQHQLQLTTK